MKKWFILACLMAAVWMYCQVWVAWSEVRYNLAETIYLDKLNGFDREGVVPIH